MLRCGEISDYCDDNQIVAGHVNSQYISPSQAPVLTLLHTILITLLYILQVVLTISMEILS